VGLRYPEILEITTVARQRQRKGGMGRGRRGGVEGRDAEGGFDR